MFARILISAAVASVFAFPALAADSLTNPNNAIPNAPQTTQNLPAQIRSKLEQDGFTDVNVVPGSFLVSAKDKSGDPVTMVIGPNSMMMLTQVPNSTNATTGSAVATQGQSGANSTK
jgi:hypothetical protein